MFYAQRGACFYCGKKMRIGYGAHPRSCTADHFFPKSKGHAYSGHPLLAPDKLNIVAACRECNQDKDDRDPTDAEIIRASLIWGEAEGKSRKTLMREYRDTAPRQEW